MAAPKTFLLVEDDPNDVWFVEQEFKLAPVNLQLRAVPDGEHAIRYLEGKGDYGDRQRYPVPDVILLDLKMPKVNGFEFLDWLHSKGGEHSLIPVVVMSSSALESDVQRSYALGANSYLVKPVNWPEFRARIRALGIYWAEHVETPGPRRIA